MTSRFQRSWLAAAGLVLSAGSAWAGDLPNGRYAMAAVHSGKCADVAWASTADGANIAQVGCNGNNAQLFDVADTGGGWYKLINVNSRKAVDVAGNSAVDGANVQQWSDNGSGAQRFAIRRASGDEFTVVNQTSGKCVDVANWSTADGANILQWSCSGGANQRFKFVGKASDTLANGRYRLMAMNSGKCMDVAWASTADGANVAQVTCNGNNAQAFDITDTGSGWYKLINVNSRKAVDVQGSSVSDGANVQQWTDNGSGAQRFAFKKVGVDEYTLVNRTSGKCVDVAGAGAADGTNIQQWSCNGSSAQRFKAVALNSGATGGGTTGGGSTGGGTTGGGSTGGGSTGGGTTGSGADLGNPPNDDPNMIEIGVKNNCKTSLWINAAGAEAVLQPDRAELTPGATRWFYAPKRWTAARVTAFAGGPYGEEMEKAEMTLVPDASGTVLNYNVTYVDWLGLPIKVTSVGGGADCRPATCNVPQSTVLSGCPDGLRQGNKCIAPRTYCLNPANQGTALCKSLDAQIQRCATTKEGCGHAINAKTPEAFACSGAFAEDPKWCAALNRGMLDNPTSADTSLYYRSGPYSNYSKWVHQVCPGLYSFPYDDYPPSAGESGFRACTQGKQVQVTFCPAG